MSFVFIALGVFLGIYAFFVQGATWNVGGITWNNMTGYLNSTFWNNNPTTGDIIKALYGSGDEGSIYTQNWTGYTSGTCLNNPMSVEYTWVIPATIEPYTIYVIASGNHDISSSIDMADCSALISSGTVIISGGNEKTISITNKNIILDNIHLNGNNTIHAGVLIQNTNNITTNNIETYAYTWDSSFYYGVGILGGLMSHTNIINSTTHNNGYGMVIMNAERVYVHTLASYNNGSGLRAGKYMLSFSGNSFSHITLSWNSGGIIIEQATNNIFEDVVIKNNTNWLIMTWSHNNILTGIVSSGNNTYGINFSHSSYNTWNNIITRNNVEEWIYLHNNSTGNNFINLSTIGNGTNGIYIHNSNNNQFSWIIASGQLAKWAIEQSNSNNTTMSFATIYNNKWEVYIDWGVNNLFKNFQIYNNTGGFNVKNTSGAILDTIHAYDMLWTGSSVYMENTRYSTIQNSNFFNTGDQNSLLISWGHSNTISGTMLSWAGIGILLKHTYNNFIKNSSSYNNNYRSIYLFETTGHTIQNFSWYGIWNSMYEENSHGLFLSTLYDTATQNNNHILLESNTNASLTGTVAIGWIYNVPFDELSLISGSSINIQWATSFTVSWASWSGILYKPTSVVWQKAATATETGITQVGTILDTIEVVSGSTYLTMNGGTGTIVYQIPAWTSGQYLKIFKSNNGDIWTVNAVQSWCILDEDLLCEFTFVGDIKLFAFWVPTNLSFTGYTLEDVVITSGWYYNTWVYITFTGDYISGATLNGSPYSSWDITGANGNYVFILTDEGNNSTGISFTIDTVPPSVTLTTPASGTTLYTGTNVEFRWTGYDNTAISGYTLHISWTTSHTIPNLTVTWHTIDSMLSNWEYTRRVVATDIAGNTRSSDVFPLAIRAPFTGQITLTWPNTTFISPQWFTKDYANISMRANDPVDYTISGQYVVESPVTGNFASSQIYTAQLTGANGRKDIFVTMSNSSGEVISRTFSVFFDTVAPIPTLITPASGATITTSIVTLSRSAWADAAGISGYQYFISPTNTFGTIIKSWTTTTTSSSVSINTSELGWIGSYYRYVKSIDRLGNVWTSAIQSFIYSGVFDTTPNQFSFTTITGALLSSNYQSNTITIAGMTPGVPVLASVNRWALYISGNFVGTTGYIQNGQTAYIILTSSSQYNTETNSTLTIGGVSSTFRITTRSSASTGDYSDITTNLSNTTKLQIIAIFEALRDLYAGDKATEFFNTLLVMLQNRVGGTSNNDTRDALQYLRDLVQYYGGQGGGDNINNTRWIVNGHYTAPNGKRYKIIYDNNKQRFSSPDFVTPKYFPTLDTLKYIIDINNPLGSRYATVKPIIARWRNAAIDGTRQSSPYTAPNKKVFYFFKDINGRYSSYTFTTERWFNSLNDVKEFIYNSNK